MCGGRDASPPPAVRLRNIDTGQADQPRPKTQSHRPPTSQRPEPQASSSQGERKPPGSSHRKKRPSTSDSSSRQEVRPSTSGPSTRKDRPSTSSSTRKDTRPSSSSNRPRTSATGGHISHRQPDSKKRQSRFDVIPENSPVQYTKDKTIIDRVAELHTLIDQHVENFYRRNGAPGGGSSDFELQDATTRYGIIRYRIAREIIDEIVMSSRETYGRSPKNLVDPADSILRSGVDIQSIATRLSSQFKYYAITESNNEREGHIYELCYLGAELWRLISSSPSTWEFGKWDKPQPNLGFMMVFPTLLQDDEQAAPRRIFRI